MKMYRAIIQCFHGIDKKGHPIHIECLGKADCSKLKNVTNVDRFLRFHIFGLEKAFAEKFPACSRGIDSRTRIVDLDGLHWNDSTAANIFIRVEKINLKYYPQRTCETFFVNAGMGFRMVWALTEFLDRLFKNPVGGTHVLGRNFQNKLLEVIDEDQLPAFLGGSCSCPGEGGCLRSEKGPWKDSGTMKAANVALVPNFEQVFLPEMIHNVEQALPGLKGSKNTDVEEEVNLLSDKLDEQVFPEMIHNVEKALHGLKGIGNSALEEKVDALSDKLDIIQATLNRLLIAKQQATN